MTTNARTSTYKVQVDTASETYEIRGLQPEEVPAWSELCASVFSSKSIPPPASYFERHYFNDPTREAALIRVAFYQSKVVASCRLFLRSISYGGGTISAGGIGEVCTANDHRRRGLSKVLLLDAIEIMKERKLQVSLLHAAPAFFPVYQSIGYRCSTSQWSVVSIDTDRLHVSQQNGSKVRPAIFPDDTPRLSQLHQEYSERAYSGCIVRTTEYWNSYLSVELQGSFWVLEHNGLIVAWLSIRPRGDRFQLREFGVDQASVSASKALSMLLSHAIRETSIQTLPLVLPTLVLDQIRVDRDTTAQYVDWNSETSDDDLGWMYLILDESIDLSAINRSKTPHLIWPSDSF